MSRTLRFGTDPARLAAAMDRSGRLAAPRRTREGFDAAAAYAAYIADLVTHQTMDRGRPAAAKKPTVVTFRQDAPGFGKRTPEALSAARKAFIEH